jgi:hypothetical protein
MRPARGPLVHAIDHAPATGRQFPETARALVLAGEEAIANVARAAVNAPVNAPGLLRVLDRLCQEAAQLELIVGP